MFDVQILLLIVSFLKDKVEYSPIIVWNTYILHMSEFDIPSILGPGSVSS